MYFENESYILRELIRLKKLICQTGTGVNAPEILVSTAPLTGVAPTGYKFGINKTLGVLYFINTSGNWTEIVMPSGGSNSFYYEVTVGTPEADTLLLFEGTTVFSQPILTGRQVEIFLDLQLLPDAPWNGNAYFTKGIAQNYITFSNQLYNDQRIKIKIL